MTTFLDRLLGREPERKATFGGPALIAYQNGVPLSVSGTEWQDRARAYLAAYKVGWFYKAGSRIAADFASLSWTLSYEDTEGDNAEQIVAAANNVPFASLDPLEQFLRLAESPNPFQTGRAFRQQQQIRLDFTGRAVTYLEGGEGGGLPTGLYGISPCRMWQARDNRGQLIGWVMDKDRPGGGVPFGLDEILATEYPGAEDDPQGVVEAVYAQVPLTRQLPQHVSDVLATGGRLAGMAWPKERSLSEDEFTDAQRAWRNITSDPNAARRLLLFPEPMEYEGGAASPSEIGIPELAMLSRDEILTAFPIAPEMLMVPMSSGLNSGQTQEMVEERYWSGTMHPRVETWEDAFQQVLIPRYEAAVGRPLDFDIEEPNLDNAPAIIEKVGAYKGLIAVGFDPKDALTAVGLDHIKWNGLPALLDPAQQAQMAAAAADAAAASGPAVTANDSSRRDQAATVQTVAKSREDLFGEALPGLRQVLEAFLVEQRARVIERIKEVLPPTKAERRAKALPDWWDSAAEDAALLERLREAYVTIGRGALQVVADKTGRVVTRDAIDRLISDMLGRSGLRITEINETTRRTIAQTLDEGVRRGYSILQLANGVPDEAYGGVQGALMANGVNVWDGYRAELIARTETMNAYNQSALLGYNEFGIRQVEAIDGDYDAECESRNGQVYGVGEALGISDHPNGTLDWAPIVDKAWHGEEPAVKAIGRSEDHTAKALDLATKALEVANARPEPVFHLHPDGPAPIVNVDAPDFEPLLDEIKAMRTELAAELAKPHPITVNAPDVTVFPSIKAPDVTVNVDSVRVVSLPDRVHRVQRDNRGKPIGSVATDA